MSSATVWAMGGSIVLVLLAGGAMCSPHWYLKVTGGLLAVAFGLAVRFAVKNSQVDRDKM